MLLLLNLYSVAPGKLRRSPLDLSHTLDHQRLALYQDQWHSGHRGTHLLIPCKFFSVYLPPTLLAGRICPHHFLSSESARKLVSIEMGLLMYVQYTWSIRTVVLASTLPNVPSTSPALNVASVVSRWLHLAEASSTLRISSGSSCRRKTLDIFSSRLAIAMQLPERMAHAQS